MKLSFFSLGTIGALAHSLAQRIRRRYPPVIANTPEPTVSPDRVEEILTDIFAGEFRDGDRPGILARATLGFALRRSLREIGYDDKFVDFAARKLSEQLTTGSG